jgi:putative PIG3 family NAD(P)H quinone oxidoreductase
MKAVQLHKFGGIEELFIGDAPMPKRGKGQVLVKVYASALNRADLLQRQGKYPPPSGESEILGLELAGEVIECDTDSNWRIGQRVMGLLTGGGQSEFVIIPEGLLMPVPDNLSFIEAAAIPEVFLTAYQTLFFEGGTVAGQTALIHAGASGVGTAAIQLAVQENITPYVTCSAGKHQTCLDLGAVLAIDYHKEEFAEVINERTRGQGVNIILDFIGAPNFKANILALAEGGRLVLIALMGGAKLQELNLRPLMGKHLTIIGTTLRSRSLKYKMNLVQAFSEKYLPLFSSKEIKPIIDSVYRLEDIVEAHHHMESNKNIGKIVIEIQRV